MLTSRNPALQPYDLTGYRGISDINFFTADPDLKNIISNALSNQGDDFRSAVYEHLNHFGELAGHQLNDLIIRAHQEGKYGEIRNVDKTGSRQEVIEYCYEQNEARRICYEAGLVNLDEHKDWTYPFSRSHRMALAFLANLNGEGGVTCPLAMTDGLIIALERLGTAEQKDRFLPILKSVDSTSYFMAGQYLTERVGGSQVGENRTIAEKQENGTYRLFGEKWFCSNPGDVWVTTARVKDTNTIGMFLVSRLLPNGEANDFKLIRKKDIIGSRGKVTAELVYEGTEAEPLGRVSFGLANMVRYIIQISRMHVTVAAMGMARRAVMEAIAYCNRRTVLGMPVFKQDTALIKIFELDLKSTAVILSGFRSFRAVDTQEKLGALLTPLLKFNSTKCASTVTHEAMLLLGGNGILNDFSVLPRLHNDSLINETWEGAHPVIAGHTVQAFLRKKVQEAWQHYCDSVLEQLEAAGYSAETAIVRSQLDSLEKYINSQSREQLARQNLQVAEDIYAIFSVIEFFQFALRSNDSDLMIMAQAYCSMLFSRTRERMQTFPWNDTGYLSAMLEKRWQLLMEQVQ